MSPPACQIGEFNSFSLGCIIAGLEGATGWANSPDGKHSYVIDIETSSLSAVTTAGGAEGQGSEFVDRRVDMQDRLSISLPTGGGEQFGPRGVCGWTHFTPASTGSRLRAAAAGCPLAHQHAGDGPDQACAPSRLTALCGIDCCMARLGRTYGYWLLNPTSAMYPGHVRAPRIGSVTCPQDTGRAGGCTYTRPINSESGCIESYATTVKNAAFRDASQRLGAALLTGPVCKHVAGGIQSVWDRNESEALGGLTFAMQWGGGEGAVQFDGIENAGLVISSNIDSLIVAAPGGGQAEDLPREALTAEVWFTMSEGEVAYAGLVGVQQDGTRCYKGWSLAYENTQTGNASTTMHLTISLEANQGVEGFGQFTTLTYSQSPGVPLNTWTHLVATYDQENVTLFVNGAPKASAAACDSPPCGKIVYPSRLSPGGDCR